MTSASNLYAANQVSWYVASMLCCKILDVQFEWCFADAKLSLLKYGYFVSAAVQHNLFV